MIDLIALDLDGTLLDSSGEISARNRQAIHEALRAGIRIVLVTGRGAATPIRLSRELGLNLPVICCHGALTKDFTANRTLGHIPVQLQYAKPIIEYGERNGLSLAVYVEESFYFLEGDRMVRDDVIGSGWQSVKTFSDVLHVAPTLIRLFGNHSVDAAVRRFGDWPLNMRHEQWDHFPEVAITSKEAGKREALARLCADFQIPAERVMAIGDSRNDLPMLRWSGVGIAMENAPAEVRESVRFVTASNDANGVADAIERYALRQKIRREKRPA
ncbi:MAG: HAD family phosphatase [Candidatus Eremiobacteraeota bacterium]|nr:HAD family phosphatase [Candidatus Eremiobacteraeota bacterium]